MLGKSKHINRKEQEWQENKIGKNGCYEETHQ
jgi:hypothetical protein